MQTLSFLDSGMGRAPHLHQDRNTHHDEVPHASSFRHQRGDAAAAGHQDDLNGLRVQKVIQQLGGFSWVTLEGQNDKVLHRPGDEKMDASINNEEEK